MNMCFWITIKSWWKHVFARSRAYHAPPVALVSNIVVSVVATVFWRYLLWIADGYQEGYISVLFNWFCVRSHWLSEKITNFESGINIYLFYDNRGILEIYLPHCKGGVKNIKIFSQSILLFTTTIGLQVGGIFWNRLLNISIYMYLQTNLTERHNSEAHVSHASCRSQLMRMG